MSILLWIYRNSKVLKKILSYGCQEFDPQRVNSDVGMLYENNPFLRSVSIRESLSGLYGLGTD